MLRSLENYDDRHLEEVRTGEITEAAVRVEMTAFERLLELAAKVQDLAHLVTAAEGASPGATRNMRMMSDFAALMAPSALNLIAVPTGNPKVRTLCRLERTYVGSEPLEGEMPLLGKIQRKLRPGERAWEIQDPLISPLRRAKQREFVRLLDSPTTGALVSDSNDIAYPGAVLTAIALYR